LIDRKAMPQQVKHADSLPEGRMALVDALRGLAALWVAAYHFYNAISERGQLSWFEPLKRVLEVGDLGVMVFFVLSGFVIACSVHRARVTGRYVGIFALRRSLRLDPTYWTVIWLTCLMAVVKGSWNSATTPVAFTSGDVLLNMCYLNRLVQGPTIVAVGWTLCLEVQFYLVFVVTCWVGQAVLRRATTVARQCVFFVPVTVYSLAVHYGLLPEPHPGLFVPYWYLFMLGTVSWYVLSGAISPGWLVLMCGAAAGRLDLASSIAAATAAGLFLAGRFRKLGFTQDWRILQYLGKLSYSFYLMHPLLGNKLIRALLARSTGPVSGLQAIGLFAAALAISLAGASAVFWLVERPSHILSRKVAKYLTRGDATCSVPILVPIRA
jgi:peptidoglycan/LPS O-acetylase OafA/YrhL